MAHRRQARDHQVIAVLTKFPEPFFPHRSNFYYSQLLEGMESKAQELGFRLEEFPTQVPGAPDGRKLTRIFRARGIRGVVFFQGGDFNVEFPDLEWEHFAIVGMGFHSKSQRMHRIATDQLLALEMCLEYASQSGAKRIGLALTSQLDPRMRYAAAGRFFAWQQLHTEFARIPPMRSTEENPVPEDFYTWMLEHQPDCVIGEWSAIPGWVREVNPRMRKPASCIMFNRVSDAEAPGVDARLPLIGKTAISVLARELYLNHYGLPEAPEVILVSGAWREASLPKTDSAAADLPAPTVRNPRIRKSSSRPRKTTA